MNCLGLANFVTRHKEYLYKRATLLDLITVTDRKRLPKDAAILKTEDEDIYTVNMRLLLSDDASDTPIVVAYDGTVYGYAPVDKSMGDLSLLYKLHDQADTPIMDIYDEFMLSSGMIDNFNKAIPEPTTYGRFILNYYILAKPFGKLIPYINSVFNHNSIQRTVARLILNKQADKKMYDEFMNNIYYIGSFTELSVPGMTTKSLTTGPDVIKRRDELFEIYKDRLTDPLVIAKIEDELIAMDKNYLKNDPASGWIITSKEYDTSRKKMFITSGVTEAFSKDANEFVFIPSALNEKLDISKFPAMCGDIRRGSYMRGKETAKGGESTKLILRLGQNVAITADDCHSTEYITITLYASDLEDYEGRYVLSPTGQIEQLTKENFGKYIERPIKMRSPKHCHAENGFCYTCFGERYKQLDIVAVGMQMVKVSSTLMQTSMKAMHKSKVKVVKIPDLNAFVI